MISPVFFRWMFRLWVVELCEKHLYLKTNHSEQQSLISSSEKVTHQQRNHQICIKSRPSRKQKIITFTCFASYSTCAFKPPSHPVNSFLWKCRLLEVEVEAGLLPALKRFSQLRCLWLPLSEGHIMALRRPGFLHNNCFLCPRPVRARWLGVWVTGWLPDRLTNALSTSVVVLGKYILSSAGHFTRGAKTADRNARWSTLGSCDDRKRRDIAKSLQGFSKREGFYLVSLFNQVIWFVMGWCISCINLSSKSHQLTERLTGWLVSCLPD